MNPTFSLEDPKSFTVDLLEFIRDKTEAMTAQSIFPTDDTKHGQMALESLANVIRNNTGVEFQLMGHYKSLFRLLDSPYPTIQVDIYIYTHTYIFKYIVVSMKYNYKGVSSCRVAYPIQSIL